MGERAFQAIHDEINAGSYPFTMLAGDFNADLDTFASLEELMQHCDMHDVWGMLHQGHTHEQAVTCRANDASRGNRRDYILMAGPLVANVSRCEHDADSHFN
eukprot:2503874-Alexandrium_andersonii.AAC.1